MGGMGGKNDNEGPFSPAALAKLKSNPRIAKYFEDPSFRNMFEMI
jgi:hypothetical protein